MKCRFPLAWLALVLVAALRATPAAGQDQTTRATPQSPFFGSVPKGTATAEPMALSVKEAVQRALQNNLGLLLQEESQAGARGARWRALADLLPDLSGSLTARRQVL